MARVPVVSRTIKEAICDVMTVDVNMGEVMNVEIHTRFTKDEKQLEKAVKAIVEQDETKKFVQIVHVDAEEALYVMTEADFIKYAERKEVRNTK